MFNAIRATGISLNSLPNSLELATFERIASNGGSFSLRRDRSPGAAHAGIGVEGNGYFFKVICSVMSSRSSNRSFIFW